MNKLYFTFLLAAVLCLSFGTAALAQSAPQVQTNSATSIQNNSAVLNGYLTYAGNNGNATVWFQWGTSAGYGYQTPSIAQNYAGSFSQTIIGLQAYATYHYRAVTQSGYGTIYGQDMTFYTSQSNSNTLTVNAGSDLYLTSGQTATLQGSGYDPNGYALNYYWTCAGGTLSNYSAAQPIYTAPYSNNYNNYNNQTSYTCNLTVTNDYGGSNSDSAIIYINSNGNNNNYGNSYVQTNSATEISGNQATLNGYLYGNNNYNASYNTYAWFQWGTDTNYSNITPEQLINYSSSFMQNIANLNYNTTYHYRAVAQGSYGTVYGQDMTLMTFNNGNNNNNNYYNNNYYGSGALTVTKQVIDLSSGNLNWQSSVNASPSDILSFAITLQANGQSINNAMVRDILPANLVYKGNLTVNTNSNFGGDITSGVNIGTVYAGQAVVVAYQAQVASAINFSYGTTTLTNNTTVTSTEAGTQTSNAAVTVNKASVQGAETSTESTVPTNVSTGLTNNFLTDSFFLPLLLIIAGLWFYLSGAVNSFADWLKIRLHK